jgi:hypothetical protein
LSRQGQEQEQQRKNRILLAYYHDPETKLKLPVDSSGNFKVDFGNEVKDNPPRAGIDSVYTTIYVKNEHHYAMELKPQTLDSDLKITEYPEFLEPNEVGKVTLSFSPSADRTKPLEGGSWDFTKIVIPRV